jgi:hypothetical protein
VGEEKQRGKVGEYSQHTYVHENKTMKVAEIVLRKGEGGEGE